MKNKTQCVSSSVVKRANARGLQRKCASSTNIRAENGQSNAASFLTSVRLWSSLTVPSPFRTNTSKWRSVSAGTASIRRPVSLGIHSAAAAALRRSLLSRAPGHDASGKGLDFALQKRSPRTRCNSGVTLANFRFAVLQTRHITEVPLRSVHHSLVRLMMEDSARYRITKSSRPTERLVYSFLVVGRIAEQRYSESFLLK